jgi:hypothetical protein
LLISLPFESMTVTIPPMKASPKVWITDCLNSGRLQVRLGGSEPRSGQQIILRLCP